MPGLVPCLWVSLLSLCVLASAVATTQERIDFGNAAFIPGGMKGTKVTFADGLNVHIYSPRPQKLRIRRRLSAPSPSAYDVAGYAPGDFVPLSAHAYIVSLNDTSAADLVARIELPLGARGRSWLDADSRTGNVHVAKRVLGGGRTWIVDPTRKASWVDRLGSVAGEYVLLGRRRDGRGSDISRSSSSSSSSVSSGNEGASSDDDTFPRVELRRRAGNDGPPPTSPQSDLTTLAALGQTLDQIIAQASSAGSARDGVRAACNGLTRECDSLDPAAGQGLGVSKQDVQKACATLRQTCTDLQASAPSPPTSGPASGLGPPAAQKGPSLNAASPAQIIGLSKASALGRPAGLSLVVALLVTVFAL